MHASAPLRGARRADQAYARARLETVTIEERYGFRQTIAQNGIISRSGEPAGTIDLRLPYDGDKYLGRQALEDIRHAGAQASGQACVGHLTFTSYQDTDLDLVLDLAGRYGSLPINVPVSSTARDIADDLAADSTVCHLSAAYKPQMRLRDIYPLAIELRLRDLDTAGFTHQDELADTEDERSRIMQHVSFRPELLLEVSVRLLVPRDLAVRAQVTVSRVGIKWPTHTSLGLLEVKAGGERISLRYNPNLESLEWFDVPMRAAQGPPRGEFVSFVSPLMELSIPQPGELYDTGTLEGQISVTVDRLLSGTGVRLFDATGRKYQDSLQPDLKSVVDCDFTFILDDAFADRKLTPYQQMHFDEVIPDDMRVDDIRNALTNLGYRVTTRFHNASEGWSRWWLTASRTEGPERLWLDLLIEGNRFKARRSREVPGGLTYRTSLESGDIRVYVYGTLPGDSHPVVRDVNALRRALDERFDRLPARR